MRATVSSTRRPPLPRDGAAAGSRRALGVLFVVIFVDLLGFGMIVPSLPYLARDIGADATAVGFLFAVYTAGQMLFAPLWGTVSDRIGRKPVIVGSVLAGGVALILTGVFHSSFVALFVLRGISGIAAANVSTASAYIADVTEERGRAHGMALIGIAFGLGFTFGPALGALLAPFGNDAPFYAAGALALVNGGAAIRVLREPVLSDAERAARRVKTGLSAWQAVLRNGGAREVSALYFLMTAAITVMEGTFAFYVADRFGKGAREVGLILAAMGLTVAVVQGGAVGRLSRRLGDLAMARWGLVLLGVGLGLAPLPAGIGFLVLPLLVASVGRALAHPALMALASASAGPGETGRTMGVFQSSGALARLVGPPVGGLIYTGWGISVPFLASAAIVATALVYAARVRGVVASAEGAVG